jgi:hypothetical protein
MFCYVLLSERQGKLPIFEHAAIDKRFNHKIVYNIKGLNALPLSFIFYKMPNFSLFDRHE